MQACSAHRAFEITSAVTLAEHLGAFFQHLAAAPSLVKGDIVKAAGLLALALFQGAHEIVCIQQRAVGQSRLGMSTTSQVRPASSKIGRATSTQLTSVPPEK
jgi:hypothetical protein